MSAQGTEGRDHLSRGRASNFKQIEDSLKREYNETNADAWESNVELNLCSTEHHHAMQNIKVEHNKAVQGLNNYHYNRMVSDQF